MFNARTVANTFIKLAGEKGLTNMQVQKLVYITHGYFLAANDKPLIKEDVRAWNFGPVIPQLYRALQKYGNGRVSEFDEEDVIPEGTVEFAFVKRVYELYGEYSGSELSRITHQMDTPWTATFKDDPFGIIPPARISEHYQTKIKRRQ